ncbi:hypothetical protein ACFSKL_11350 [Belliella marina]|uniref:DUF5683 domain-containing protein n=1 Tax=Belliella marina TaxID=1644146 RepID=A0ABW4VLY1_9BACT
MKTPLKYINKIGILIFFITAIFVQSHAQSTKDFHPIIVKKGFFSTKYFYDDQTIESPYGLQIPLMQLDDPKVTKDYNVFKKAAKTAKIVNLISSGFSLYVFFNRDRMPGGTYWSALGTAGAVSAFFNIRSGIFLDKAVKKYNNTISGPEFGFQYDKPHLGNGILKLGISQKF